MANEDFDSGHVVLPVLHPDGNVDNIAVPTDTPLSDLHDALSDYYLPDLAKSSQPSAAGAVENSDAFKQRAQQAWDTVYRGMKSNVESGFQVGQGGVGQLQTHESAPGGKPMDEIQMSRDAVGVLHTHPSAYDSRPSPADIKAAQQTHKTVWVTSKDGLFAVDPAGKVTRVFNRSDWMKK